MCGHFTKCVSGWSVFAVAVVVLSCSVELYQPAMAQSAVNVSRTDDEVAPYLLFASYSYIWRLGLNESDPVRLLHDPNGGIISLDYHYRLGYMYWISFNVPSIKRANLADGSNFTVLVHRIIRPLMYIIEHPAGLAVDWINDKLFWTDRDAHLIAEYDLSTGVSKIVYTFEADAKPLGIGLFPHTDFGWLYITERQGHTLTRLTIRGSDRVELRRNLTCSWPVTLDHVNRLLLWADYCDYEINSIKIDGSEHNTVVGGLNAHLVFFAYGVAHFNDTVYWTQTSGMFSHNLKDKGPTKNIYNATANQRLFGMQVIHPTKQPSAEDLNITGTCFPACVNGQCIPPGLCACKPGYAGTTCSIDIDECADNNGGCTHSCVNTEGGFHCTCSPACVHGRCQHPGVCDCEPAFRGPTCAEDKDECSSDNGGCSHLCENTVGGFHCSCPLGLFLQLDKKTCLDFDPFTPNNSPTIEIDDLPINMSTQIASSPSTVAPTTVFSSPPPSSSSAIRLDAATSSEVIPISSVSIDLVPSTRALPHLAPISGEVLSESAIESTVVSTMLVTATLWVAQGTGSTCITISSFVTPLAPPTEGDDKEGGDTLLIIAVLLLAVMLVAVLGICYAALLVYRYKLRRRKKTYPTATSSFTIREVGDIHSQDINAGSAKVATLFAAETEPHNTVTEDNQEPVNDDSLDSLREVTSSPVEHDAITVSTLSTTADSSSADELAGNTLKLSLASMEQDAKTVSTLSTTAGNSSADELERRLSLASMEQDVKTASTLSTTAGNSSADELERKLSQASMEHSIDANTASSSLSIAGNSSPDELERKLSMASMEHDAKTASTLSTTAGNSCVDELESDSLKLSLDSPVEHDAT